MTVVMTNAVVFSRALSDSTRWRIVLLVMDEALCVCELADILDMPHSSVSSHVQVIRRAGLLESERCGKWTYFRIAERFLTLIRAMDEFFAVSADPVWTQDAQKAVSRMAERQGSCCPGPKNLLTRKTKRTK